MTTPRYSRPRWYKTASRTGSWCVQKRTKTTKIVLCGFDSGTGRAPPTTADNIRNEWVATVNDTTGQEELLKEGEKCGSQNHKQIMRNWHNERSTALWEQPWAWFFLTSRPSHVPETAWHGGDIEPETSFRCSFLYGSFPSEAVGTSCPQRTPLLSIPKRESLMKTKSRHG